MKKLTVIFVMLIFVVSFINAEEEKKEEPKEGGEEGGFVNFFKNMGSKAKNLFDKGIDAAKKVGGKGKKEEPKETPKEVLDIKEKAEKRKELISALKKKITAMKDGAEPPEDGAEPTEDTKPPEDGAEPTEGAKEISGCDAKSIQSQVGNAFSLGKPKDEIKKLITSLRTKCSKDPRYKQKDPDLKASPEEILNGYEGSL